ncbi:hypothetical protein D9757_013908 [Collybiopsis confluens]|uniref:Uncharacterized protein n=1 Tax=Collybiopsis confluens TaxID=2823264 RepID=A0A8H5FPR8_9AGAR|nr:hypothetical protein D9757_013908 [Collybiopsis confluens]
MEDDRSRISANLDRYTYLSLPLFTAVVVKELVSRAQGLPLHFLLEYDRPLTPMETRNFWEIFLIIMSNSSSWHFLRIEVVKDLFVEICGHFSGGREAPLLRQLELVVLQSSTLDRHHPDAHDPPPIYLELRRTPLLRHLVLHGIHLRMPSPIFMEQLEILDIDSSPAMEMLSRPPLPNHSLPFQHLFAHCPWPG